MKIKEWARGGDLGVGKPFNGFKSKTEKE